MTAPSLLTILMVLAALGCGLTAGVFFTFSAFVMSALARLPTGALLHLVGCLAVTRAANVPCNMALAQLDPQAPDAAEAWGRYGRECMAWNHLRGAASLAAAAALTLARP